MQIGRIDVDQIVRLARTGNVTIECMIGATTRFIMVKTGKAGFKRNLPLVSGLGKSLSHLKDSFQGSLEENED